MPDILHVESEERLEELLARSVRRPVWIFKHSLSCPISSRAWAEFQAFVQQEDDGADYAMIPIQRARPVSQALTERTGVRHESPQALLLRDGQVVWHASHGAIHLKALREAGEK